MSRSRSQCMSWWEAGKDLISTLMKSVVCVRCVSASLDLSLTHTHTFSVKSYPQFPAVSSCCAILHHWCGELVLCYCCLPPSFPIPESSSTWLSTRLQRSRPSTPPLAVCVYMCLTGCVGGWRGCFLWASHNCTCVYISLFVCMLSYFLSASWAAYLSICPISFVCACVSLQMTLCTFVSHVWSLSLCVCVSESAAPGWLSRGEAVAGLSEVLRDNVQSPRLQLHWQLNYVAKHMVTGTYLCCWHTDTHTQAHTDIPVTVVVVCHNTVLADRGGKIWRGVQSQTLGLLGLNGVDWIAMFQGAKRERLATKTQTGSVPYVCNGD